MAVPIVVEGVLMAGAKINLENFLSLVSTAYHPYLFERARYLLLWGGAGSAKSYTAAQKFVLRVILEPGHRLYALRKIERSVRLSCFSLICGCLKQYDLYKYFIVNQKEMRLINKLNGSMIQCGGLDDPEKIKSIYDPTGFWLEEATEFSSADIRQINLRLRGNLPNYKQIILTFNPISQLHHIRKRFFSSSRSARERASGRLITFQSTYKDNDFIDEDYKRELEEETDSTAYMVYTLGEWGVLENVIYGPVILIDDEPHELDILCPRSRLKDKIYGVDFGYANPSAVMEYKFSGSTNPPFEDLKVYEREIIYEKGLTTDQLITRMNLDNVDKGCPIYCDAADPAQIEALYVAGFNARKAYKAQGSVEATIKFVKGLEIYGYPTNVNSNQEAETYRRQKDRDGNVLEAPVDADNHAMSARGYALFSHLNHRDWCEAFDPRSICVG